MGEQGGADQHLHAVRQPDPEQPLGRAWIETVVAGDHGLDLGQRNPHGVHQGERARRRTHALGPPGQELVTEHRAQAREVVAHGRLTQADAGSGARHIALGEQGVESHEQVQVDRPRLA